MNNLVKKFDYLVIGAGSGGIASSRWAAKYGLKVAVIEHQRLGGTCVNVGCVPKKICYQAASFIEDAHVIRSYGIDIPDLKINWKVFKEKRDAEILRLNGIYNNLLKNSQVEHIKGMAKFISDKVVECEGQLYSSDHILIATGSAPTKTTFEGSEYTIDSNDFFDLEELPESVVVTGSGYIGVEIGQIFNGLGVKTHIVSRSSVLSSFDIDITSRLTESMIKSGIQIEQGTTIRKIEKFDEKKFLVTLNNDKQIETNLILAAQGREPNVKELNLQSTNIKSSEKNSIIVDEFQNTSVQGIYALGDVTDNAQLTPVAIRAGRMLAERLFQNKPDLKMDYTNIPTVVFSHPPIGTIGLTEKQARLKYGDDNITIYQSGFGNMYYVFLKPEDKPKTYFKLICVKDQDELVVGLHGIGKSMDEILQGFGVAIKMGATKKQLDSIIAIHPTSSEEFVTMNPKY